MGKKAKSLAGAGQARQQGAEIKAEGLYQQNNPIPSSCQGGPLVDNSTFNQRAKMLAFLQKGQSLTTLHARNILGICHPGMRICELRQAGHVIETVWVDERDAAGVLHRVGKYILKPNRQLSLLDLAEGKNGSRSGVGL